MEFDKLYNFAWCVSHKIYKGKKGSSLTFAWAIFYFIYVERKWSEWRWIIFIYYYVWTVKIFWILDVFLFQNVELSFRNDDAMHFEYWLDLIRSLHIQMLKTDTLNWNFSAVCPFREMERMCARARTKEWYWDMWMANWHWIFFIPKAILTPNRLWPKMDGDLNASKKLELATSPSHLFVIPNEQQFWVTSIISIDDTETFPALAYLTYNCVLQKWTVHTVHLS